MPRNANGTILQYLACIAIAITSLHLAGCDNPSTLSENEGQQVHTVNVANRSSAEQPTEPSAEGLPSARTELPAIEYPEFPTGVNFFALPNDNRTRSVAIDHVVESQSTIQLIGFANSNPKDPSSTIALLKVDDRRINVRVGETFAETTLVSIDGRSITLKRDREQWTLVMMEQSVTNPAIRSRVPNRRPARSVRRTNAPKLDFAVPHISTPPATLPDAPAAPTLPGEIDLPKLPEMPEMPGDLERT